MSVSVCVCVCVCLSVRDHIFVRYHVRSSPNSFCMLPMKVTVEESIRMTEDRDKWRKYVHGVANPRIEDG